MASPHDTTPTEKVCNLCGETYPLSGEYWYAHKRHRDGWASNCKACDKARAKKWAGEHKERVLANVMRYQAEHPEETRARKRKHYDKNFTIIKERARLWNRAHPELIRKLAYANNTRRRALKRKVGGTYTRADVESQYRAQNGKCWWCAKPVGNDYHADHLIPLTRGGSNAPENIVVSCPHCNQSRGNKLPHEWSDRLL